MATVPIKDQIIRHLDKLSPGQQKQVLDFTASLVAAKKKRPRGTPGQVLLERMKDIHIDPADLAAMEQAIEEEFEKVNLDDWDLPA